MYTILKSISTLVVVSALTFSCGKKEYNTSEVLAGSTSKTWKISKQTDSNGDKEKLSSTEKEEKMNFYADGKFSIVSEKGTATGTWNVQSTVEPKTLTLQFQDQTVTENFAIVELKDDEVTLKAGDGSKMILKEN